MMTKYNIGDELYIKVTVKSINITDYGNIRYYVKLPSIFVHDGVADLWEDQLYNAEEVTKIYDEDM